MYFLAGPIERIKKPQSLDMIHMEMGEQEVDARFFRSQAFPEASDPRAGIEHQHGPVIASYFDT
jgi:hypothetical protein